MHTLFSMQLLEVRPQSLEEKISILWYPTKLCNFDCSYCHDLLHDNFSPVLSDKKFNTAVSNFLKLPNLPISLSISGGEPFLDSMLGDRLKLLKHEVGPRISIGITTNGSMPLKVYEKAAPYIDSMTVSWHFENWKGDKLLKKIEDMQEMMSSPIRVNLMFLPGLLDKVEELVSRFRVLGIIPIARRVRRKGERVSLEYSKRENDFFKNFYEQTFPGMGMIPVLFKGKSGTVTREVSSDSITGLKMNYFEGWECEAGSRYFTVWNDGYVYSCEATLLKKQSLGYFYGSNFQWPSCRSKYQLCPVETCVCLNDIKIPKRKLDGVESILN